MYLGRWELDDYLTFAAQTHDSTGAAADADAVPSYAIYENETAGALVTGNMAKLGAVTGFYTEQVQLTAAAGFELGKCYAIRVSATVGGVAAAKADMFQVEGDAYAVVAHADYGNAKLVRSTTPANTLTVDASHQAFADVSAISGDSTAADHLEAILDAMPGGAVVDDNDPDPTATAFETTLSEATNDHYNGAFVVFTSGALLGQSRKISDYDGTSKVLTVAAAFTEAPTVGDTFLILGRSE